MRKINSVYPNTVRVSYIRWDEYIRGSAAILSAIGVSVDMNVGLLVGVLVDDVIYIQLQLLSW